MIRIAGLTKVYKGTDGDVLALENLDLEVDKGDIFGIIGLSGAGKSTLIRCINLLERPTAGSIRVDGKEITGYDGTRLRELRSSLGMIFQHFNLLSQKTVRQNVTFPLEIAGIGRKEARSRTTELLELVSLSEKAEVYPSQLSGGQKQRVAIARALANRPKVLLCDEATSALDPLTTQAILALLARINKEFGLTILLITHEMAVIREICNRVAVMDNNRIVETGPVMDVIADAKSESARMLLGRTARDARCLPPLDGTLDLPGCRRVRVDIVFTGEAALKPVISTMARRFDVEANILRGNVDFIQGAPLGELMVEFSGPAPSVEEALGYLHELGLKHKVLAS
jgi:D-methionine transport system ATP-binding protein